MRVRFTREFRGVLTYEHHYQEGDLLEVPDDVGQRLIDKGRAINDETERGRPDVLAGTVSSLRPVDAGDGWTASRPTSPAAEPPAEESEAADDPVEEPRRGRRGR